MVRREAQSPFFLVPERILPDVMVEARGRRWEFKKVAGYWIAEDGEEGK